MPTTTTAAAKAPSFKVSSIETYKGNTKAVSFEAEEHPTVYVHEDIVAEFRLRKGSRVSESAIAEMTHANDVRRARERALYLLDFRDFSYVELFRRLHRNYDDDICYEVMNNLSESGIINDRRYAEHLAEYLFVTMKYGFRRARSEMRRRGLSDELIEEASQPHIEVIQDRIEEIIRRKYSLHLSDEKFYEKAKLALLRRGYSADEVNEALSRYVDKD